jgi:hypothetical protein
MPSRQFETLYLAFGILMVPPTIAPVWCVRRRPHYTSTLCRCPATAPTSCRSRLSAGGASGQSHFEVRLGFGFEELTVAATPNLSTLPRLTARRRARRGFSGGDRILREPHGQTAPLPQRLVILCPIRHASLRPRNMVAAGSIHFVRHEDGIRKAGTVPSLRHPAHPCNTLTGRKRPALRTVR